MDKRLKNIVQFVIFISIGVGLFWLVYRNADFVSLWEEVKKVNYYWFILELVLFILAHMSRAARWMMLLETMNYKPRFWNTFYAVLVMYFVNLGIPRMGEIVRCGIVSKYDNIPVSKVLGTMISERVFDMIMLILLTIGFIAFSGGLLSEFISNSPELGENLNNVFSLNYILLACFVAIVGIIMIWLVYKEKLNQFSLFKKISNFLHNLMDGLMSFKSVKKKGLFILHTLFIWFVYYIMLYIAFQAFDFTREFSMFTALFIFVVSSYGMVVPAPNGMGAYHFMVIQCMLLLGVGRTSAETFALISHSIPTLGIILGGIIAFIAIPIINRNTSNKKV